jgi:hypothetical protein
VPRWAKGRKDLKGLLIDPTDGPWGGGLDEQGRTGHAILNVFFASRRRRLNGKRGRIHSHRFFYCYALTSQVAKNRPHNTEKKSLDKQRENNPRIDQCPHSIEEKAPQWEHWRILEQQGKRLKVPVVHRFGGVSTGRTVFRQANRGRSSQDPCCSERKAPQREQEDLYQGIENKAPRRVRAAKEASQGNCGISNEQAPRQAQQQWRRRGNAQGLHCIAQAARRWGQEAGNVGEGASTDTDN